jgi:hypothetical protein
MGIPALLLGSPSFAYREQFLCLFDRRNKMACVGMFFFNCSIMSFSSSSIEWEKHNQKLAALFS